MLIISKAAFLNLFCDDERSLVQVALGIIQSKTRHGLMRIYLSGISDDLKKMHFDQQDSWLLDVIQELQEAPPEAPLPSHLDLDVYKSQELAVFKGKFRGNLNLVCSRCANPFDYGLQTNFHCLFTRDKSFIEKDGTGSKGIEAEDIDIEFLDKEFIELKDVIKEQLYLKIPFQPLCNEACKGLCATCGQNQNTQPCQCHRLRSGPLAHALKNIRLS